ncbi:MAG: BolA family transcriptional regulator, partial [Rhodobacterales bacterium]|nr:BolA family transcriptional regulator [Rhodobacterales bacterium]
MTIAAELEARLQAAFVLERLEIHDDSEKHRGHAGWR